MKRYKERSVQLRTESKLQVMAEQADGIAACKELLAKLQTGETKANFFEGMGCPGGCEEDRRAMLEKGEGRKRVEQYGAKRYIRRRWKIHM